MLLTFFFFLELQKRNSKCPVCMSVIFLITKKFLFLYQFLCCRMPVLFLLLYKGADWVLMQVPMFSWYPHFLSVTIQAWCNGGGIASALWSSLIHTVVLLLYMSTSSIQCLTSVHILSSRFCCLFNNCYSDWGKRWPHFLWRLIEWTFFSMCLEAVCFLFSFHYPISWLCWFSSISVLVRTLLLMLSVLCHTLSQLLTYVCDKTLRLR